MVPASTRRQGDRAVGNIAPIVGRPMPWIRPRIKVAAERTAPVFPALTNASACPSFWRCRPIPMDDLRLVLSAAVGRSCISMTSGACTMLYDSGGGAKAPAILAALRSGLIHRLITDEEAARLLLAE